MYTTQDGLQVVLNSRSERELDRELRQLDPNLFLNKEWSPKSGVYYVIGYWNGERAANPVSPVLDWREGDIPKPLNDSMILEVKRMMQRGPIDSRKIAERNQELKRQKQQEMTASYMEMVRDIEKHSVMGNMSGPVHRSRALYLARSKNR